MQETPTTELLARLADADVDGREVIAELVRRREPAAARPLIRRLTARAGEDAEILAALAQLGTRAVLPLLRQAARTRPELAEALETLHAQLRRPPAETPPSPPSWQHVGGGRLAIGPRPRVRALAELGATHVATLLSESEGARELGAAARGAGLQWLWLPLPNGEPPSQARTVEVLATLDAWIGLLAGGAAIYLHCAAGIHRTGMIGYGLLRRLGMTPDAARQQLSALRAITAAEVGERRLEWGDRAAG